MFSQKEIDKFTKILNNHKNNFIISSKQLSDTEENELKDNVENMFKPISNDISDFDIKKKFIEDNIIYTDKLKRYIINDKMQNPDNYLNIDETLNDIDNLDKNLNSKEKLNLYYLYLVNVFKIMEQIYIYQKQKILNLIILKWLQFNH